MARLVGSLKVPCVKELAKDTTLHTLPDRYVRDYNEETNYSNNHNKTNNIGGVSIRDEQLHIPVIDLEALLLSIGHGNKKLEMMHHACKRWGFFQLINHGVNNSLVEKVKLEMQELFNLPMEEKKKLWQESNDIEGFGQVFVESDEQKLDWADMFYITTLPNHFKKPRLFRNLPLHFRQTLEAYSAELKLLSMKILELMEKALKMKEGEMMESFEQGMQSMRMNYYPTCPQPELAIGLSPHSDGTGLTILLQANEIEGLQVKKDGMWIPVKPLPNAFIINIGDMLEVLTNGVYKSIEHRATVNKEKERLSIATFLAPNFNGFLGPSRSLVTPETPALYRNSTVADFFKRFLSQELKGKSHLDVMRIHTEEGRNN